MGNLFSKMSKVANPSIAEFIYVIELHAAARENLYNKLSEAREAAFQSLKTKYGFERYNSYEALVKANKQRKVRHSFQKELLESQIKWFVERGFAYILN